MNKNIALLLLAIISSFFAELTLASSSVYECIVKTEYRLNDSGIIAQVSKDVATAIEDRFMVDRDSGRITGKLTDNKIAKDFRVLNRGDQNNSFIAISRYWSGSSDYLQINEYVQSSDKPFILVFKGFWVNAGVCH